MAIAVAIVEDDQQAREIVSRWFARTPGFRLVGDWGDAETALTALPAVKPNVVLMDISLPGISGVEAVRQLKPLLPETQFLMVTVYEEADYIYDALTAGATGYLLKQASKEELLNAVRDVHQGGSPITSNIARKVVQFFRKKPSPAAGDEALSPREQEVLELVTRGYRYKEIADRLNISVPTVNTYVRRTYEKLHVCCRAEAVAKYSVLTHADTKLPGASAQPRRPA
jgi:DNA-binding NarL/FixJ family response regulator